ncbi:MAG: type II toxin-antitoxin system prevent-host-death family antitoxin [Proteobacteria bacterium]|nr:type II toxin-antitoxin system prevent-host-death family antitoxin [Pseudomonadota bacterium]
MSTQFITDGKGKRTAVILPVAEYEELQEDLQDLAVIAERRDEPTVAFADVVARLKKDGRLPH